MREEDSHIVILLSLLSADLESMDVYVDGEKEESFVSPLCSNHPGIAITSSFSFSFLAPPPLRVSLQTWAPTRTFLSRGSLR